MWLLMLVRPVAAASFEIRQYRGGKSDKGGRSNLSMVGFSGNDSQGFLLTVDDGSREYVSEQYGRAVDEPGSSMGKLLESASRRVAEMAQQCLSRRQASGGRLDISRTQTLPSGVS